MINRICLLAVFMFIGCTHEPKRELPFESMHDCLAHQIDNYGDLCAESSTGYESMSGSDAHYEGVICAIEYAIMCEVNSGDGKRR